MASSVETEVYSARNEFVDMIVPIDSVKPSPLNPRRQIDDASLQELAASIREVGLLEPIVVRPIGDTGVTGLSYHIVAGERRWRACKMAGLTEVPVRVLEGLDDAAALKLALLENLQRQDLDPLEEAEGYRRLAQLGHRQREIGELVGKSQPAVANSLRLLDLPPSVQEKIRSGQLSASHGVALASYRVNSHVQEALADLAVKEAWPAKKLEGYFASTSWLPGELQKFVYELRDTDLWDWKTECRGACPHDAFRAGYSNWQGWCLRPGCYEAKARAAKQAREADLERQLSEARAAGSEIPKLDSLPWGSYERLDLSWSPPPPGCREDCDRRVRVEYGGDIATICTDLSCYRKLKAAETKARNKAKREAGKQIRRLVVEAVSRIDEIGSRELALLASVALGGTPASIMREVYGRHVGGDPQQMPDFHSYTAREEALLKLPSLTPLQLTRVAVEGLLLREIHDCYESYGGSTGKVNWYLSLKPGTAEPAEPTEGEERAETPIAAMAESPATPTGYFDGSDGEELTREEEQGV